MDQETMANASDGAILTGTVDASIPLAVGLVCGGEVILGVGTVGGTVTAGGTATTGGIGTVIGTEIIDTTAEVLAEKATGYPVIIPCSIPDLVQDGGKLIVRRAVKEPAIVKEGIYEFIDTTGKKYVGQSGNIEKRIKQHIKKGKLDPSSPVTTTEVLGGKTTREIAEHNRIQVITGGVPARISDKVSNKVDPIGPNRKHLLD